MPSQITGKKAIVSDSKVIPAEQGIEDICAWKSCIVSREGCLGGGCIIIRFFAIHPLFACSENSMVSGGGVFAVFPKYAILGE